MSVSKVVLDVLSDDMKRFKIPTIAGRYSWFKMRVIKAIMARKAEPSPLDADTWAVQNRAASERCRRLEMNTVVVGSPV